MRITVAAAITLLISAVAVAAPLKSGLQPGQNVPSYEPMHVAGPDKGKSRALL